MIQEIHKYLELGWSVLPLKPRDKVPLTPHGVKDASADSAVVTKWWTDWPDANVGVATGDISGVVVVDIDQRHGGFEQLKQLTEQHGELPATPTVETGGGGLHYYFQAIGIKCRQLAEGVDLKGTGGYVVAPPSVHPSGGVYRWVEGRSPFDIPIAPLPDWIVQAHNRIERLSDSEIDLIPVGKRNLCLFDLACYLRRRLYLSASAIHSILAHVAQELCEQPEGDQIHPTELYYMAQRVCTYELGPNDPREFCNDLGVAHWIIQNSFKLGWIYIPDQDSWYQWSGSQWKRSDKRPSVLVTAAIDRLTNWAEELRSAGEGAAVKELLAFSDSLKSNHRINAVLDLTESLYANLHPTQLSNLDRQPYLLNCPNGVVDLRTGRLLPHNPSLFMTQQTTAPYVPDARSEIWEQFLDYITGGDQAYADYLQLVAGYCATGETKQEQMWLLLGPARSGKSTFIGTIHRVLGSYSFWVPGSLFANNNIESGEAPSPALANMRGKRLVVAIELPANQMLKTPIIKSLTGGDVVTARFLYRDFFTFTPICKIVLAANEAPNVPATDTGIWRRLVKLPFEHSLTEDEADPRIKEALFSVGSEDSIAVLAWIVRGAMRYYAHYAKSRIPEAEQVKTSTLDLKLQSNPLYDWVDTRCELVFEEGVVTPLQDLWNDYLDWAMTMHEKTTTIRWFVRYLVAFGAVPTRPTINGKRTRCFKYIRLIHHSVDSSEQPNAETDAFEGAYEW